jgi:hypothetical protein
MRFVVGKETSTLRKHWTLAAGFHTLAFRFEGKVVQHRCGVRLERQRDGDASPLSIRRGVRGIVSPAIAS